jgi:hypothetical protein
MTNDATAGDTDHSTPFIIVGGPGGPEVPASEVLDNQGQPGADPEAASMEAIERPAKVMRIGSMIKQLLEEVRQSELDEPSRKRLREIYELSVHELAETLSPDLAAELDRLALPFGDDPPSGAELRVAQAQLVGWLEGLFHGIQATLFAQQMAAQAQIEQMHRRSLPAGMVDPDQQPPRGGGTYL